VTNEYALEMIGIAKAFPGVKALGGVDLRVRRGELHGLVGENGAGKSTLMNVLGGLVQPDAGRILVEGAEAAIAGPADAARMGVGFVHQESNLLNNLSVLENVFLAREALGHMGRLDRRAMAEEIEALNRKLGYNLKPFARVGDLSLAQQQSVEITRALIARPRILILDEPTAALGEEEVERLFRILAALTKEGVAVIYISHRLDEVVRIADRVTVLKDGCVVGTLEKREIARERLISMMVGRVLEDIYPDRRDMAPGKELLTVEKLNVRGRVHDLSFAVRAGEIVGIGGLEGQGQRDALRAVFGERAASGRIALDGVDLTRSGMATRIRAGLGYMTHDRRNEGLVLTMSLVKNASLAALFRLTGPAGIVRKRRERAEVRERIDGMQIKAASIDQMVVNLSGGNQQKVMLARWLLTRPKVLLIDEPTRGVDVGARMSVYRIIDSLTRAGIGIVMLTSDMMELLGLSDRILVFYGGRVVREYARGEATEELVIRSASGLG